MAVKDAEKDKEKGQADQKSPEEIAQEEAAAALLKEIEDEEKDDSKDESKDESEEASDDEDDDGQSDDGETGDDDSSSDSSDSQSEKSPKKGKRGYKRRHTRLIEQRNTERKEKDQQKQINSTLNEENKLLKLKLQEVEGKGTPLVAPIPGDFQGGEDDPEYRKANQEYQTAAFRKIAKEEATAAQRSGSQQQTQDQAERELQRKQKDHWDRADKMDLDDYDEKEEKLMKIIGADMMTNIIDYFPDDSEKLIYHLGTNEETAEKVGDLLENRATMVKGVAELGRILERINVKGIPKKSTPNPDEDTEGSAPSAQDALQAKLETLREDASKTGRKDGMKRIRDFKRKARARGIELV